MLRFNKILVLFAAISILLFLWFIVWIQLSRIQFKTSEEIKIYNQQKSNISSGDVLNILLWNISYGGMPNHIGFFYSGGTKLRLGEDAFYQNFEEIMHQINNAADTLDLILLHKIDTSSKRSYYVNQIETIKQNLLEFEYSYCLNFSVPYIPIPLDQAIGTVHSGMMTLSRFQSTETKRIALDSKTYYWPKRLFTAQRCMSVNTYEIAGTPKHLHLINAHLDSYDFQGEFRLKQLQQIWKYADSLEKKGDYVIVGGGWNMVPPGFKKHRIKNGYLGKPSFPEIDSSKYFPSWKFDYRMDMPTSRSIRDAYRHGAISTSIKDFFICSPNIAILEVNTADQQFANSDHQAVFLQVFLRY